MSKMKVWEYKMDRGLLLFQGDFPPESVEFDQATSNYEHILDDDWYETTRYEITERKPDYKAMAERGQIGRNGEGILCRLVNYLPAMTTAFEVQYFGEKGAHLTPAFTPCAEPKELDPITMEPV